MLRLSALTALALGLVTFSRAEAQEDLIGGRTAFQHLASHVAQIEIQVKMTKLKKIYEEIASHELELATVVIDEVDSDQARLNIEKKQKLVENLKTEATSTREQISDLAKALPQGYRLQISGGPRKSLSPSEAAQELRSCSLKNTATKNETAPEVLAVKVEFTKAQLITELLWGVLRAEERYSMGADERANLIVLRGEKQWIENARKLVETLDRCGSPNLKAAELR